MLQFSIHYGLHFGLPLVVALLFFKTYWIKAYGIMLLAFVIDLDHLLASPIFEANRCSINFHPLHSYYAIVAYFLMVFFKRTRLIGIGLVAHIISDATDCFLMQF